MKFLATNQLFALLLFKHGVILVVTLRCQSPQYVILGQQGIIECSFPRNFTTMAWFDSLNETAVPVAKIEPQPNGEFKRSGDGYDSGSYNILLNGSLIIPSVTIYHDRTFRVLLVDKNFAVNNTYIVATTTVYPIQTTPAVNVCGTDDPCFVNSMENDILNCTYTGARPAVMLTWYAQRNSRKDTINVSTTTVSDGNYTFTSISTLDISDVTDNPLTVFTCEASGPALGFKEVSTSVFVYDVEDGTTSRITERNVVVNSSLDISCPNLRSPTAFVWSFQRLENSRVLVTSANSKIEVIDDLNDTYTISKDGTLNFMHVDNNLEGIFTCTYLEAGESSLYSIRVIIIDGATIGNQKSPAIVIIVIVLIILIILVLFCATFCIWKHMSAKSKREYEAVERNPLDDTSGSLTKEASLQSPKDEEESGAIEMENYENSSPEFKEEPVETHEDKPTEETSLQPTTSEQEHHDDETKDYENINPDPMAEASLQPPDNEETCPADEIEEPENIKSDDGEEEKDTQGNRTAAGALLSNLRIKVDHDDREVDSIVDLEKGDHIVFSGWALHPRCHGIVVDTNIEKNELRLVRFTYQKGVVEEWKTWKPPIYKVLKYYIGGKSFSSHIYSPDAVVERARSMINNDKLYYSIGANNCKTFARWCKTDARPDGYGYD